MDQVLKSLFWSLDCVSFFFQVETTLPKNHDAQTVGKFRKPWGLSFFALPCGRARYHLWAVVEGMHVLRPLDPEKWWLVTSLGWLCLGFFVQEATSIQIYRVTCRHTLASVIVGVQKLNFEVMETGKSIDGNDW